MDIDVAQLRADWCGRQFDEVEIAVDALQMVEFAEACGETALRYTDPSHPDHIKSGCAPGAKAKECPGSVTLVLRELRRLAPDGDVGPEQCDAYLAKRRRGLTKSGLLYWLVSRIQFGGVPFMGGPKLPEVDEHDPAVALPAYLAEG